METNSLSCSRINANVHRDKFVTTNGQWFNICVGWSASVGCISGSFSDWVGAASPLWVELHRYPKGYETKYLPMQLNEAVARQTTKSFGINLGQPRPPHFDYCRRTTTDTAPDNQYYSLRLLVCLTVRLLVCMFSYQSVCLSFYLSVYISV